MTDYKTLMADARRWHDREDGAFRYTNENALVNELTDAVEALVAERDALQARLDTMTTEWGTKIVSEPGVDLGTEEYARRNVARWNLSPRHRGAMAGAVVRRLVGPWVEVAADE